MDAARNILVNTTSGADLALIEASQGDGINPQISPPKREFALRSNNRPDLVNELRVTIFAYGL